MAIRLWLLPRVAAFCQVVESEDATLKGGATPSPLLGAANQTLKLRPPKDHFLDTLNIFSAHLAALEFRST